MLFKYGHDEFVDVTVQSATKYIIISHYFVLFYTPLKCMQRKDLCRYRGHPCFGLAAIIAGMLYNVQIIEKCSTRDIMHARYSISNYFKMPAKVRRVID